jgi:hypothetical protein
MAVQYQGEALVPGIQAERTTVEAQLYFGRWEQQSWAGGVIEAGALDAGHTDQLSQLRPGLCMGTIAATGKLTEWNPYANDGSHILSGFLNHHIDLDLYGTPQDRYSNLLFYSGNVKAGSIIVPSVALNNPGEFDGNEWEWLIREQLKHRFVFDDDIFGEYTAPKTIEDATAALEIFAEDTNTLVSNQGSALALALTLPDPLPGLNFSVLQIGTAGVGRVITVDATGAGNDFIDGTEDLGADSTILATEFGITNYIGVKSAAGIYSYVVNRMPA